MEPQPALLIAEILILGIVCQWLAWRLRVPAILPLLAVGFLVGPVFQVIRPEVQLGRWFFPFVSLSVAIILFEGALALEMREARQVARTVRNLVTLGLLITWVAGALAAWLIQGFSFRMALLFGALITVTGPTVIAPLLRNVRPTRSVASILKWESILIDPLGALLAVLVFDALFVAGTGNGAGAPIHFLRLALVGALVGGAGAALVAVILRRYLVPDYLRDGTVLSIVAALFALSNALEKESGLLTVVVMGMILANLRLRALREIQLFKEKISVLLLSTLFILLPASVQRSDLALLDGRSVLVLAVVMLAARPLSVWISSINGGLSWNERAFLGWVAPRGIVAAAVSSLFAYELRDMGVEEANLLAPLVFLVIVGTVTIQSITAKPLAKRLGVAESEPQGFLIVGAHSFGRALARVLASQNLLTRLVDTNRSNFLKARREGLDAVRGNILSQELNERLELNGLGRLLALTSNDEANALACLRFQREFGSSEVYQISPDTKGMEDASLPLDQKGRLLFSREATIEQLEDVMRAGARIKITPLTEEFTFDAYNTRYRDEALPLVALRGPEAMVATVDAPLEPLPGWTLVSLVFETPKGRDDAADREEDTVTGKGEG